MSLFLLYLYCPIEFIKKLIYSEVVKFAFDIQKAFIMDISVQNMAKCKYDTNYEFIVYDLSVTLTQLECKQKCCLNLFFSHASILELN